MASEQPPQAQVNELVTKISQFEAQGELLEKQFEALRRRIPLAADAELSPPPGFEGRDYRLSLSFSSREDLRRHRQMLDALLDHRDLEQIFSIGSTS